MSQASEQIARQYANSARLLKMMTDYKIEQPLESGKAVFYMLMDDAVPVIASTDAVAQHIVAYNKSEAPNVWASNIVGVKNVSGGSVLGMEISMSNNTSEQGNPLESNTVLGLFISYIHTANKASAAIAIGGLTAGWKNGLWIDGVSPDGTAIKVNDDVSDNQGLNIGIDLSDVSSFITAAILLGNDDPIAFKDSTGGVRFGMRLGGDNSWYIGGSTGTSTANTVFRMAGSSGAYHFQNDVGDKIIATLTNGGELKLESGAYVALQVNGSGNTSAAATSGSASLPSAPAKFLVINIGGTNYKIPVYNN